jgi:competence protein ComEA
MMRRLLILFLLVCCSFSTLASAAVVPVDINMATATRLESISGIGPAKARAIIEYRSQHGPFRSVEELDRVKGIGPKTLEKIRSQVTVGSRATGPHIETREGKTGVWRGVIR